MNGYPWQTGDALFADELNAAIANAGATGGGAVNVIGYGADPTGVIDSSPAFAAALAARPNGRPADVFAPAGTYLLNSPITVGDSLYSQRLSGAGWSTILTVGPGFPASALGVILIQPDPYNDYMAQASVCDLRIHFQQPPDFTTTATTTTTVGGTTLTVANTSGVHVGYYCMDMTTYGVLPWQSIAPKVTNIAGNVVTLDRAATGTVAIGDVLAFAANRSQAVTLASSPNLNPGSPAIKYPWAIYVGLAQSVFFDHILVTAAWNGIYIRGQTFAIGQYFVGCMNIGLDIDQCYNFPKLDHFMLWGWGIPQAMLGIYYDGQTVAMNLGQCDDFTADSIQSWCGIVNFTSAWSWGQISKLKLDGDNADLNIVGNGPGSWVQIGEMYKSGGQNNVGVPIVCSGACRVHITELILVAAQNNPSITLAGGELTINGGYMWNGQIGGSPMISVAGGDLCINQMRFDSSAARGPGYLVQTGGSVRINNSVFLVPPAPGAPAFILVDNARNAITNVVLNGWGFTAPGPLGRYEVQDATGIIYTNRRSIFAETDTLTSAQVTIKPTDLGPNAQEGKLRLYGVFPTGSDTGPRLSASIRAGFATTSWTAPYLDFWVANGTNDVASDANMLRVARFTLGAVMFPVLASSTSYASDAAAAAGGVAVGQLYRNASAVMVRVT